MRFPSIWTSARPHRNPEIAEDEARFVRWLLGSGPPPGPRSEGDDGIMILSPVDKSDGRPRKPALKWWR
jgi:hypothetical protein